MGKNNFHMRLPGLMVFIVALAVVLSACQPADPSAETDDAVLQVTVSVLPQAYFVERIGGDRVKVNVMVGPGEDAHTYEPKPEQMIALSQSTLFFSIGIEYETAWLPRFADANPDLNFVDTAAGIDRLAEAFPHLDDEAEEYADDDDDDHADELDPHIWLSPRNGKVIASHIFNALAEAHPENEAEFKANYEALLEEIDAVDQRITQALSGVSQRKFMVYHPAWGYFARDYGLVQLPIQTGGTDPSASELAALIDQALAENIRVIFVQPTFSAANARAVAAEIGGEVVTVDPLARDWLANLENVAEAFATALGR
jgi:zinc transport system substrate-binding protein